MEYENRRYINPLNDFGFKHLFGNAKNKDVLIDFLNQLFKGEKEIVDLIYSPTEHAGDQEELKKVVFDLLCTGVNGEQFIIEMQRGKQLNFKDRAVFYTSRLINEQLLKGKRHWNIELKEVYFIGILDFCLEDSDADNYMHNVSLTYKGTGENFYDKLFYKFIELPKFDKGSSELESDLDRWLYLLKHMSRLEKVPEVLDKDIFQRAFAIAEIIKLTKEEKDMFDFGIRAEWDYKNVMDYAKEEAAHESLIKVVHNMKKKGATIDEIVEYTELPLAEIVKLTKEEKDIFDFGIRAKWDDKNVMDDETEEAIRKNSIEIASEMKKEGLSLNQIVKVTKLSVSEIENL